MNWEIRLIEFFQKLRTYEWFNKFVYYGSHLGEIYLIGLIISIIYWFGDAKRGYKITLSFIFTIGITTIGKVIFKRPRPYDVKPELGIGSATGGYSFPSGHSTTVGFIVGTGYRHRFKAWLNGILIGVAVFVAWSRMYLGQHYLTDVLVGLAIGVLGGYFIYRLLELIPDVRFVGHAIVLVLIVAVALGINAKEAYQALGFFTLFHIGYIIYQRLQWKPIPEMWWFRLILLVLGLVVAFGLKEGIKAILPYDQVSANGQLWFDCLRYSLIGIWVALGAPYVFQLLSKLVKEKHRETTSYNS